MMKRIISAVLAVFMIFSFAACGDKDDLGVQTTTDASGVVEYNTVGNFDYSDFKKEFEGKSVTDGFKVTAESEYVDKQVAKKIAAEEFSGEFTYTSVKIAYDYTEGIWRVSYISDKKTEHICIDETGKTILIVKEK